MRWSGVERGEEVGWIVNYLSVFWVGTCLDSVVLSEMLEKNGKDSNEEVDEKAVVLKKRESTRIRITQGARLIGFKNGAPVGV